MLSNDPAKWIVVGILAPLIAGQAVIAPIVAVACGFVLSGRQNTVNARVGCALGSMLVALTFITATNIFHSMPEYTGGQIAWYESHYEVTTDGLPSLDRGNKTRIYAPSYADANKLAGSRPENPGPFHLIRPKPLWHTFLTGIYRREIREFRIWLPGGTADQTLDGALAVPVGTPAGSETKAGVHLDAYFDEDRIRIEE